MHEEPLPPRGATGEPCGSHQPDQNSDNPDTYDGPLREPGSQSREPMPLDSPGLTATPRDESAGGGSPPDSLGPAQTPDSCLGVKGSPVQIRPSRQDMSSSEGFGRRAGALFDVREPDGHLIPRQCRGAGAVTLQPRRRGHTSRLALCGPTARVVPWLVGRAGIIRRHAMHQRLPWHHDRDALRRTSTASFPRALQRGIGLHRHRPAHRARPGYSSQCAIPSTLPRCASIRRSARSPGPAERTSRQKSSTRDRRPIRWPPPVKRQATGATEVGGNLL